MVRYEEVRGERPRYSEVWEITVTRDERTGEALVACPVCGVVVRAWTDAGAADALCAHMNQAHWDPPARGSA